MQLIHTHPTRVELRQSVLAWPKPSAPRLISNCRTHFLRSQRPQICMQRQKMYRRDRRTSCRLRKWEPFNQSVQMPVNLPTIFRSRISWRVRMLQQQQQVQPISLLKIRVEKLGRRRLQERQPTTVLRRIRAGPQSV